MNHWSRSHNIQIIFSNISFNKHSGFRPSQSSFITSIKAIIIFVWEEGKKPDSEASRKDFSVLCLYLDQLVLSLM